MSGSVVERLNKVVRGHELVSNAHVTMRTEEVRLLLAAVEAARELNDAPALGFHVDLWDKLDEALDALFATAPEG